MRSTIAGTPDQGEEEWKTETQMRIVNEIHKSQPARPEKRAKQEEGRNEEWIWSGGSARVGSDSAGAQALNLGERNPTTARRHMTRRPRSNRGDGCAAGRTKSLE